MEEKVSASYLEQHSDNNVITYSIKDKTFKYPESLKTILDVDLENKPVWTVFLENRLTTQETAFYLQRTIEDISKYDKSISFFVETLIRCRGNIWKSFRLGFIRAKDSPEILITVTDIDNLTIVKGSDAYANRYDELTGLFNKATFCSVVNTTIENNREKINSGKFALIYFDILKFKAVNDIFGIEGGNQLLKHISDIIMKLTNGLGFGARINSDRFAIFVEKEGQELQDFTNELMKNIADFGLSFKIAVNLGIYVTNDHEISASSMIDRAALAQSTIKGSYLKKSCYYTENLRETMLSEQKITGTMAQALENNEFAVYYQPQYNHSTGLLVGSEALVRWIHPEKGMISPGLFIPIFEKNGFITTLDLYVFEQACKFIRKSIDNGWSLVPVSTNFSRYDIFQPNFVEKLETLRKKHDVPVKYIRVEITESAVVGGSDYTNQIVQELHKCGYIVEMDDFGSGYSSLNVLKDINLDIIKFDMKFLADSEKSEKGGTIISSMVRMAKWLSLPVIAEGVETLKQADFLKSIGCDYIQGYFYSKPLPEDKYIELLKGNPVGTTSPNMHMIETMNTFNFWNPESIETIIFNNYIGGAAIFDYQPSTHTAEVLRVNEKFVEALGMNLPEKEIIESNPVDMLDEPNRIIVKNTLLKCIETDTQQECECWVNVKSACCGEEKLCLSCGFRMLGKSKDSYLFYISIRNITKEILKIQELSGYENSFKQITEQANIYYWEYNIITHDMKPCFRCMRDLGLPPVVKNYPEPVIESGLFPQDYADMYRDWMKQLENGAEKLEAVIPLTKDRIPFHVRYTTEFDVNGKPVKAYASATLVVD